MLVLKKINSQLRLTLREDKCDRKKIDYYGAYFPTPRLGRGKDLRLLLTFNNYLYCQLNYQVLC
ncbi:MAG: hypothetical protein JWQ96_2114 [Segetibacter sp.]|nr:hypothetical protein [Segetibacter sp.]